MAKNLFEWKIEWSEESDYRLLWNTMRLSVKVLGGVECCVEAREDHTVEQLKAEVEAKLKLGAKAEQKLLYRGKPLQDGTYLSAYKLTDGSKLNLVVKREATPTGTSPQPQTQKPSRNNETNLNLEEELFKSLRKHFKSDEDTTKVVVRFKACFHQRLSTLSLDDVERISKNYNATNVLRF